VRRLLLIGIGAGDPDYLTAQAIRALNEVDVFFVVEKGGEKGDLVALRREICERFIDGTSFRTVEMRDPERDRTATAYGAAVEAWRSARAELYEATIARELAPGQVGAILVWGDPALYDSTLAAVEEIRARGALELEHEVVPGISSVQALAARHRIALNRIGGPIVITTGRRLAEGLHDSDDDVVVMLDAHCAFRRFAEQAVDIYWGAYLGTPDELLVAGRVGEVADEIVRLRSEARARKGWIMDTYVLRRPESHPRLEAEIQSSG
jgi:precorrin-6A synthase